MTVPSREKFDDLFVPQHRREALASLDGYHVHTEIDRKLLLGVLEKETLDQAVITSVIDDQRHERAPDNSVTEQIMLTNMTVL